MITQINIVKEPEYYYPAGMVEKDGLMTYPESQKLSSIPTPSSIVTKSSTAGLLKNDGTVDSNAYVKKSDIETEKTATGNPITLTDAIAGNAIEVSAEIVASQDLHGYDKPWVGGAGDNKLGGIAFAESFDESQHYSIDTTAKTFTFDIEDQSPYHATIFSGIFKPSTVYTLYFTYTASERNTSLCVAYTDNTISYIEFEPTSTKAVLAFVTDANKTISEVYLSFRAIGLVTAYYDECGIFEGAISADEFSPYENICPITGHSSVTITDEDAEGQTATVTIALGQTVYGGTLDLTSGELTVTHGYKDLGTLSWNKDTTTRPADGATIHAFYAEISEMKTVANIRIGNIMCSQYVADNVTSVDYGGYYDVKDGIIGGADINSRIWIYDSRYNDYSTSEFKSAMSGVQVVYELATPTTTTLTAAQLALVKGYNQLSCNSGDMSITYKASGLDAWKDSVDELEDRVDDLTVSDLADTAITTPTNGQVLTYNSVTGKWENKNPSGGEVYFDATATLSTSTTTTITFTQSAIKTTSVIDIAVSEWGLTPEDVTVTTGVCTVTMPKVSTARSITVRIYVR